jgi:hypothetical protein
MFSAPHHLNGPGTFAEEGAALASGRPELQKPSGSEAPHVFRDFESDAVQPVSDSRVLSTGETSFKPLFKQSREVESEYRTKKVEDRTETLRTGEILHESEMTSQQRREQEAEARGPYKPLLTTMVNNEARPRILSNGASLGARSPVTKDGTNSTRSGSVPAREADDIQIHIGRVEVTAVQQVQTRPAAKPERKSLNLDEYLKRGTGRAS